MAIRQVTFLDAVRLGFKNYFRFSGRAQRAEYWWFYLFTLIATAALTVIDVVLFGIENPSENFSPAADIFSILVIIPTLALGWRRMHDINRSGWWSLLPILPAIWMAVAALTLFTSDEELTIVGVIAIIIGIIGIIAAIIYVIVLLATDSDRTQNRYGPSPKYGSYNSTALDGFDNGVI